MDIFDFLSFRFYVKSTLENLLRSSKSAVFAISAALNFVIWSVSVFEKGKNSRKSKSSASKRVKMAHFVLFISPKLISCKIWEIEKSWNSLWRLYHNSLTLGVTLLSFLFLTNGSSIVFSIRLSSTRLFKFLILILQKSNVYVLKKQRLLAGEIQITIFLSKIDLFWRTNIAESKQMILHEKWAGTFKALLKSQRLS